MNTSMVIRPATVDDAEAWSVLARRVFLDTFGPNNDPDDLAAYMADAFTPAQQRVEIEDPARRCLLAECDGVLAGYVLLREGAREEAVVAERPVEIQRLYVDHAWHGHGVAQRLMAEALAHAISVGRCGLARCVGAIHAPSGSTKTQLHQGRHTPVPAGRDVQRDYVMVRAV